VRGMEWRDGGGGERNRLGTIIGSEEGNRVVEFAHVLELLEDVTDIVVQLLHTGFLDSPILTALLAQHSFILRRQHRRYVHTRRVVPDEERLVGFFWVVAVRGNE